MSATNHTPNLNLSQFIPLDKPAWLGDYNSDMSKIDTAVHKVQTQADSMETAVEQATTAAQAATQAAQAATEAAQDAADKAQNAETTANNIAGSLAGKVNKTGDTMTGALILSGDPVSDLQAATKKYVDDHAGGGSGGPYLPLSGGIMTGDITFSATGGQLRGTGTGIRIQDKAGWLSVENTENGAIRFSADMVANSINAFQIKNLKDPTDAQDAATKAYVDAHGGGAKTGNAALLTKVSGISSRASNLVGGVSFVTENYGILLGCLTISATVNANEIICTFTLPSGKTLDTTYSTCYLVGIASNNLQITPLSFTPAGQIISCYSPTNAMNTGNYLVIGQVFAN